MLIIFCPEISFFGMNDFHWKNGKPENVIRSASWHPSLTIFIFFFLLGIPFTFCLSYSCLLYLHLSHIFTKSPICLLLPTSSHNVPSTGTGGTFASAVQNAYAGALLSVEVTSGPWGTLSCLPSQAWSPLVEQGHGVLVCPWEPWDRAANGFVSSWLYPAKLCRRWPRKCCSTGDNMATSDCPFHSVHPELTV